MSVAFPRELKHRVAVEARRRGLKLSSTVRVLVAERLAETEEAERLTRAEMWQRAQAWASWDRLSRGTAAEVSAAVIEAEIERAHRPRRR